MKRVDTEFYEKGPPLPPFLIYSNCVVRKEMLLQFKFWSPFYLICITIKE